MSLTITIVGFFASLKFYRDGVQLQQSANNALTKLEEKTEFIQTQVGGMFDKTLDAAIGKREILAGQFAELNEQVETTKRKLIEETIGQIGAAGEQERQRLSKIVDNQMALIREKVETTRESAEVMVQRESLPPLLDLVLRVLEANPRGLTEPEIAERAPSLSRLGLLRRLRSLAELGLVERQGEKYYHHSMKLKVEAPHEVPSLKYIVTLISLI